MLKLTNNLFRTAGRRIKYYLIRLFRQKASARNIAWGVAVGFFPCWYPTFFVGPFISVVLTRWFGGNLVAAVTAASLGSFMWPALFWLNYKTGNLFFIHDPDYELYKDVRLDEIDYIETVEQVSTGWANFFGPFGVGMVLNSLIWAGAGFFIFYFIFKRYQSSVLQMLTK